MSAVTTRLHLRVPALLLSVLVALTFEAFLANAANGVGNPGIVIKYTDSYLTSLHKVELLGHKLKEKLKHAVIPDIKGSIDTYFWSTIIYSLTDISLKAYDEPTAEVTIKPNGTVNLLLKTLSITFEGLYDLEIKTEPWNQYSRKGNFTVKIIDVQMTVERDIVLSDKDKDKVKFLHKHCVVSIKDVDLDLGDPISNDVTARTDFRDLKDLVANELCRAASFLTDLEIDFGHDRTKIIYLDMSLLGHPKIRHNYVEFHHRGEIRYKLDKKNYIRWPALIPDRDPKKMVLYEISIFTLSSIGYVIDSHKLFNYKYTKADLPKENPHLLDTTCSANCFGTLFPLASEKYPNTHVEIQVSTVKVPLFELAPNVFKVTFWFKIQVYAVMKPYDQPLLFALDLTLASDLNATVKHNKIFFQLQGTPSVTVKVLNSHIGEVGDNWKTVVSLAFQKEVIPFLQQFKVDGLNLASPPTLTVTDSIWIKIKDALYLELDYEK